MEEDNDKFINWLIKPISEEDLEVWFRANNMIPEYIDLFRDFCLSFYFLVSQTYLGDSHNDHNETKIGLTNRDKENHFNWCWNKIIDNFELEGIVFEFSERDKDYFKEFFFEIFYDTKNKDIKGGLLDFFRQVFNSKRPMSKSDLEILTDLYKTLERSLVLKT
jgi:hypothetical protein